MVRKSLYFLWLDICSKYSRLLDFILFITSGSLLILFKISKCVTLSTQDMQESYENTTTQVLRFMEHLLSFVNNKIKKKSYLKNKWYTAAYMFILDMIRWVLINRYVKKHGSVGLIFSLQYNFSHLWSLYGKCIVFLCTIEYYNTRMLWIKTLCWTRIE